MTDLVFVLPGIMGSELRSPDGKLLWGAVGKTPLWLRATHARGLRLKAADGGGLLPSRLIRVPAYMAMLGGFEGYGKLLDALRSPTNHLLGAVREFPYDWRLAVSHNAKRLSEEALRSLKDFQRSTENGGARLVFVCHSMGGLVAIHALIEDQELRQSTRRLITLGTPFHGSLKAAKVLITGQGAPALLSAESARDLGRTCPGMYDLLPRFKCSDMGFLNPQVQGGALKAYLDETLFSESQHRWDQFQTGLSRLADCPDLQIACVVGVQQLTPHWFTLKNEKPRFSESRGGDGTVLGKAASIHDPMVPVAASHSDLTCSEQVFMFLREWIRPQGGLQLRIPVAAGPHERAGLDISDEFTGRSVECTVDAADGLSITVESENLQTCATETWRPISPGGTRFTAQLPPGLHRVKAYGPQVSPVTRIIGVDLDSIDEQEPCLP